MPRQPAPEGGIPTMDQEVDVIKRVNPQTMETPFYGGKIRVQRDCYKDSGSPRGGSEATEWYITLDKAGKCIKAEKEQRSMDDDYLYAVGSSIGLKPKLIKPEEVPSDILEEARDKIAKWNGIEMKYLFDREPYRIKTKSALHKAILYFGGCRNQNNWSDPREWKNPEFIDMIRLNNGLTSNEDASSTGDNRSPDKKQIDALIEKYQK